MSRSGRTSRARPLVVGAALRVGTGKKKTARYRHSATVRFRGSISPQNDGGRVSIQKLQRRRLGREGQHRRQGRRRVRARATRKSVRIHTSGKFRVVAEAAGQYASGIGRTVVIKAPR